MAKLLLILFFRRRLVDGLTPSQTEPPLLIDESAAGFARSRRERLIR